MAADNNVFTALGDPIAGAVDYVGGVEIMSGAPQFTHDLVFRVEGVPEPACLSLLLLRLAPLWRRCKRAAASA